MERASRFARGFVATVVLWPVVCSGALAGQWRQTNGPAGLDAAVFGRLGSDVFVGGRAGVWRSNDGGVHWHLASEGLPPNPNVRSLTAGATELYAATRNQGLWRSADAGQTWQDATGNLPVPNVTEVIVVDGEVFVLSGLGGTNDLFRSADAGVSWTPIETPESFTSIHALDGTLFGAGFLAVYRSADDGATWIPQAAGLPLFASVMQLASDGLSLYALTALDGLFRSDNGGVDWVDVTPPTAPNTLIAFGGSPTRSFATIGTPTGVAVFFTDNAGVTWEQSDDILPGGSSNERRAISVGSDGSVLAATARGVSRSPDAGFTWNDSNDGLIGTQVLAISAIADSIVAATARVGAWISHDRGATWDIVDEGLPAGPAGVVGLLATEGALFAGTRSSGVFRSLDDGLTWDPVNSGITTFNGSAGLQFHQVNDFAAMGNVVVGVSGGGIISLGGEHGNGGFGTAADGVFRSVNAGETWQRVTSGIPVVATSQIGTPVFEPIVTIDAFDGVFYASMQSRGVLRSADLGVSWTVVNVGLPRVSMSGFAMLDGELFAANGSSSPSQPTPTVYRFDTAANRWQPSAAGLPTGRPARDIVLLDERLIVSVAPAAPNDEVLFVSSDGATWNPLEPGLQGQPAGRFARNVDGLFMATSGRGVWALGPLPADTNCDGVISVADINPFVLVLTDPVAYKAMFPDCDPASADVNGDGIASVGDIGAFVALLTAD